MPSSDPEHVPGRADLVVSHVDRPPGQAAPARAATQQSLTSLAQRANDAHKRVQRQTGEGLAHAIEAGAALLEVKQRVVGGQWLPWLSKNVEFSPRTAQLYMKLARESASADLQHVADLSLRAAARAIAKPRTDPHKPTPATETVPKPPPTAPPPQNSTTAVPALRSSPSTAARQTSGPTRAQREAGDRKPTLDKLSRVRSVMSAIDPLLARAQSAELSVQAAAELLREAAAAARAVSDRLNVLADELEK